jgi:hypothetical protein
MTRTRLTFATTVMACLAIVLATFSAEAKPSNKWRLQFSGGADSDGRIVITLMPVGGEPIVTTTAVEDGTSENRVAKTVVKSLREQLDEDVFHVERDDGEDVLIKRRRGAANFDVEITENTVKGVRINPDRE